MSYDPVKYWSQREKPNKYDTLQHWDLQVLKPLVDKATTILEYGVGDGRLMSLYKGKYVKGFDIVGTYKNECIEKSKINGVDFVWSSVFWRKDVEGDFDLGVLSKVLLHMKDPKPIIDEMMERCDTLFISTGINCNADHCFNHDYKELLKEYDILYWDLTGNDLTIVVC